MTDFLQTESSLIKANEYYSLPPGKFLTIFCRLLIFSKSTFSKNSFKNTEKPVLSGHSKEDQKKVFKTDNHLMQVKSIAECSHGVLEHTAVLMTCTKLPHGFKTFILSIFEWLLKTGFTVLSECQNDWIQIRPDVLWNMVWVQSACKCYEQMQLVGN